MTLEELLLVVSPREEGMSGRVPLALCESALDESCADELRLMGVALAV